MATIGKKSNDADLMSGLVAPVRRALEREGIDTPLKLSKYTEAAILRLHGVGPSAIPKLRQKLRDCGLQFAAE